nr:putative reverse transcriptase domain-containing protein [Tanacetum cinerariifolium]
MRQLRRLFRSRAISKLPVIRGGNEPSRARACQSSSSARLYFRKLEPELGSFEHFTDPILSFLRAARLVSTSTRDRQKSYADVRRKPPEFQVGDKVMLKVSPWKGVIRFGKQEKLNPRYIGPFKMIAKVGTIAYRLELTEKLSRVHSTFHVLNLKKCMSDETLAIPMDEIQIDDKIYFIEESVEIIDHEVKRLKQSRIDV